jgi:hypothetical protein
MSPSGRDTHLDLLALDALRAGEGTSLDREHLERCESCRESLERLERMAVEIRSCAPPPVEIPPGVDRSVLSRARKALMERRRPRVFFFRPWARAAAALLVAAALGIWISTWDRVPFFSGRDPGDIDRSGGVDIVDAYILARRIRGGEPLDAAWDVNGDGRVDREDVDEIARQSVSISGRPQ